MRAFKWFEFTSADTARQTLTTHAYGEEKKKERKITKLCQIGVTGNFAQPVHAKFIASFTCYCSARAAR